jgi:hypothetical protein
MKLFNIFKKTTNKRSVIEPSSISVGDILKVYPASRSHVKKPYLIIVTCSCDLFFETRLLNPFESGHTHRFVYGDESWEYHKNRFEII